ncbi:MAG: FecR domain-containing protein [Terracidiphilus sp.]
MRTWFKTIALLGMGVLCASAFGTDRAHPGTLNYIEGTVLLQGQKLRTSEVGTADLAQGKVLSTQKGRAEILLTPGVFLRLDDQSAVKMITPDLTLTQVEVKQGRIGVEVDEIYAQNDLRIIDGGVATQLLKPGYYEFVAQPPTVLVYDGKAAVQASSGKYTVLKKHHVLTLSAGPLPKPVKFNPRDTAGDFYNWSSLRSQYLAEANNQMAGYYEGMAGFYPGWYWDPFMWDYTFIGMDPFWSPFGWGFYPPWWGPYYGGYYGYGHGFYHYYGRGYHGGGGHYGGGGGFHGGGGGFGGGGFHGGGGGFGGGGFHGGGGGFGGGGGGFGGGGGGHR